MFKFSQLFSNTNCNSIFETSMLAMVKINSVKKVEI